ncbi:MAG: competence/damage-inducible protein A [Clostridiales bacterium]|nr:competence/damage-inducible protein A [Clostridiales bacterium]
MKGSNHLEYTAEIICVGTELLLGSVVNTDAMDVSKALSELGINVYYHTVVGDNPDRLKAAVELAKNRADIIITTGGLGPTYDDLTKQTLAESFGKKLIFHEDQAERVRGFFRHLNKTGKMTDNNLLQAWFPEDSTILENSCGTAPGCAFLSEGKHVIMLPGPPRECRAMLKSGVVPYLLALSDSHILSHNIRVFGMGESAVEERLHDLMLSLTNPTLAPYAQTAEMSLRLTAKANGPEECERMMKPILNDVLAILGDVVYGVDVDSLEEACINHLKEKGLTLACGESCTGGLLSKRLTDIPGSSAAFSGGVVAYSNRAKTSFLDVPSELLSLKGAVSPEVAVSMAEGAMNRFGSDIAIGITGLAGPDSDGSDIPVGTVYIALAAGTSRFIKKMSFGNYDRDRVRTAAASNALDMLRRCLTGLKPAPEIII